MWSAYDGRSKRLAFMNKSASCLSITQGFRFSSATRGHVPAVCRNAPRHPVNSTASLPPSTTTSSRSMSLSSAFTRWRRTRRQNNALLKPCSVMMSLLTTATDAVEFTGCRRGLFSGRRRGRNAAVHDACRQTEAPDKRKRCERSAKGLFIVVIRICRR